MNVPHVITESNFQAAYIQAVEFLSNNNWEYYNLIVQITDPNAFNQDGMDRMTEFAKINKINTPKIVANTIFPYRMYELVSSRTELYNKYISRLYPRAKYGRWGTYFNRMIAYGQQGENINQLENIITKINTRCTNSKAAYTIHIQYPGSETTLKMGAPCLNYMAVQIKSNKIGLLAIYRNHDFLKRAYGNYYGLCKLISFLSFETVFEAGTLTCISSHAYIGSKKPELITVCRSL